jgi:DMSO/TMAO reductase YedYZ molybdopterin-dependent catalytic subunit
MEEISMSSENFTNRRKVITAALAGGASSLLSSWAMGAEKINLPIAYGERELIAFPEKKPMIVLTSRPPQLETPFKYYDNHVITPNDEFFVRYHMAGIPTSIDPNTYRLKVGGNVAKPLEISLKELKQNFPSQRIVAVNQCSGNSRGFFEPRANGGQLGNGAMGNAAWVGVSLKDILKAANPGQGAKQVTFNGLDHPVLPSDSDFVKGLNIDHAMDGDVMVAYQMNGADIPFLNGYPIKLIVPGYYGTYWVKHLSEINVVNDVYNGYWMNPAYRIPDNDCNCVEPGAAPSKTIPINQFTIRSFITNFTDNSVVSVGKSVQARGIAFDAGYGIKKVLFSQDNGQNWVEARLGQDLGRFSFREWRVEFTPKQKGVLDLRVRAFNHAGQVQPMTANWMPAGYMRNVVETVKVTAV